ncbi:hypothetical protein PAXRUDRAFT_29312 [Paxillus rubicundulus Ve08.2h10]|uniref:Uncharacterized protein n=1 Tax=Paxillus rubicundulus Ve08.2h10 TaxID=930991 RepID=A0A0D0CA03_9AGAM|nr:hypothetical protein PAXRUDRAFT_29312 [Paxillus rubicundulus Ve08.2h10]
MSLVASMASIVLGLVFVGHHRTETRNTAFEAHKRHGLETLGIIYSLPYAFLMWAMVLFFVAFVSEWSAPGDISSWTSVGSFMFLVALLVAWCTWTSREQTGYWWFQPDPHQVELDDLGEDDRTSCIPRSSFLHRLIPPSWIRNQTGPEPPLESHAMQDTTRPQDVPDSSDNSLHEDSLASDPVSITVHQATLRSTPSTLNTDPFERQTSPV